MLRFYRSYFTVIRVGGIPFRVALDTASADLWLLSSDCETEECKDVPRFQLGYQSPTFQAINDNSTLFEAGYADGTGECYTRTDVDLNTDALGTAVVSGFLARETVEVQDLSVSGQVFGRCSAFFSYRALSDGTADIM